MDISRITDNLNRIGGAADGVAIPADKSVSVKGPGFGSMLEGLLKETTALQGQAEGEITELMAGNKTNVQEVMLAVAKADLSFKLMLEVRNKLLDAYTEVMRMQV